MTAADRVRRLEERAAAQARAEAELAPAREPTRTTPVRQTVDLGPDTFDDWSAWLLEAALALGRRRVTTQDGLAAAVRALLTDDVVARRVRRVLEEEATWLREQSRRTSS